MTLDEYKHDVQEYKRSLPSMNANAEGTIRNYERVLNRFAAFMEEQKIETVNANAVTEWRIALNGSGCINNTIRTYLTYLHCFFEWAKKNGRYNGENPANEMPSLEQVHLDLLEQDEIEKVLMYKPKKMTFTSCKNRAIVVLLIQTGLRSEEVRSLFITNLDFENRTITVKGKGGKWRSVAFPALSREAVGDWLMYRERYGIPEEAPLFGTDAGKNGGRHGGAWHIMSSASLLEMVKLWTEKACGHSVGVHKLRHAYASICDDKRVPIRDIQLSMGHSSSSTTERIYISVLDEQRAARTVNDIWD